LADFLCQRALIDCKGQIQRLPRGLHRFLESPDFGLRGGQRVQELGVAKVGRLAKLLGCFEDVRAPARAGARGVDVSSAVHILT
jgi:hypothetical protein